MPPKTVAIIAPQFVPCSYPPAIRVRFFTNHLESFGWKPVVLCVDHAFMEEPADPEFTRLIPESLEILKVPALSPRWTRKLGIGDLGIRCYPHMRRRLRQLCRERKIDAVLIPGPPWHTFLLGPVVQREFGIPYVLDYIDPWVTPGTRDFWRKAFWYRQMARVLEPHAVRCAAHITAVSERANQELRRRYPFLGQTGFSEIPYGVETGDFERLGQRGRVHQYWSPEDGNLHVAYVGAVWPPAMGTVRALLDALVLIGDQHPEISGRLQLHFLGTSYAPRAMPQVLPLAEQRGLANVTELPRRIPYTDALTVLTSADVVLALGSTDPHYTASKVFPCILSKKPLVAVLHNESSAVDILRCTQAGLLVTYSDQEPVATRVQAVADALVQAVSQPGYDPAHVNWAAFDGYSARAMTGRLAAALNRVVEDASGVPSAQLAAARRSRTE